MRLSPLALALALLLCAALGVRSQHDSDDPYLLNILGAPQFGDWCDENEDCLAEDPFLECRNKRCACRNGFEYSDGFCRRQIRELPRLGNWCEESADCADAGPLMVCSRGVCQCAEGYVLAEDMCKPWARSVEAATTQRTPQPGDMCERGEQCSLRDANLGCRDGECHCNPGFVLLEGKCAAVPTTQPSTTSTTRPSRLGDWCITDDDCSRSDMNLECFGGVCLCKQGFVPEDGMCTKESPPTSTAAPATTTALPTTARPRPVRPPLLGDWCVDSQDCARTDDNMECFSDVCLCRQGYEHREGMCKKEIRATGPLWHPWTWAPPSVSLLGAACEDAGDCPSEEQVECIRGFCQCLQGHIEWQGACKRVVGRIGGLCVESTDVCYLENGGGDLKTACVGGRCACKEGFVFDDGKCKKHITKLGARCDPDENICFLESDGDDPKVECREEKCQCKGTYEEVDGKCSNATGSKELGASCQNDGSCKSIPNARCNAGKCVCKEGFGPMNTRTCGKRVGDRCEDGACDALNTQCTRRQRGGAAVQVCACRRFFLSSSNRTFCYTWPQNLGDLCDQSQNCMFLGENIECTDGRCQCGEAFTPQDGVCVEKTNG